MISPIEYQVLSSVLAARLPPSATGTIVIAKEPSIERSLPDVAAYQRFGTFEKFPSLLPETVSALLATEKETTEFEPQFSLPRASVLLDQGAAKAAFRGRADWEAFYRAFPESGGMFFLSRAGFNPSANQALVHIGRQWLGRAGGGWLVFLEKTDEGFSEVGQMSTWMS
jgi:hypothetical protein